VVEDDDMVRATSIETLVDLGYRCLEAPDGEAALEVIRRGAPVDLLFSDVVMPGPVRGRELALKARALRPGLPVLFTSGYAQDAIVRDGRLDPEIQLLSKPFSRDDLARKVRALLGPGRPVVLVVEDDPLVRMAASDMVDALGFSVLEAADADLALETLRGDARVDILFTDIGLPGMRGTELAEAALALRPGLRIVFVSGYSEADAATFEGAMRLRKPYQQEELAEVLGAATV
jgi:CheY-like chemotaxis protein